LEVAQAYRSEIGIQYHQVEATALQRPPGSICGDESFA